MYRVGNNTSVEVIVMKKAQIAGQIFIYITAVVVVGLIIAYGYSAIKSFSQRGEEVEYITLQKNIQNSVAAISSDYGSISRPTVDVSGKYEMICFVDKNRLDAADFTELCGAGDGDIEKLHQPIVCSGWKTGRVNVFLIPDGSESFDAGNIVIADDLPFLCLDVISNKIKLQLESLGDRVEVSKYD